MFPHERSLVKKMEGKPFALVGVNTDGDKNMVKTRSKKDQITWRSFFDGRTSKITGAWKVQGFPTLYLIDAKGVVREKWLGAPQGDTIDKAVEKLLKEMASEKSASS